MTTATVDIPGHVPAALVHDFDYVRAPLGCTEPQREQAALLRDTAPPLFFTPRQGGHWVVQDPDLAREMFRLTEDFSSDQQYNGMRSWKLRLLPVQVDPPVHTEYRKALGSFFSPVNMRRLEPEIRTIARRIIADIAPRGGCEFVTEVGEVYPIAIFLSLVDAPFDDRPELLKLAQMFTRSADLDQRSQSVAGLSAYIQKLFDKRRAAPGDDVLSAFLQSRFEGRALTEEEEQGLGTLLFLAGLDTVRSSISFVMLYLARNPEKYAQLVEDPTRIGPAVEELLRISGTSNPERAVAHDLEYQGVQMKRGDRVIFMLPLMSFSESLNQCPADVDLTREAPTHLIFGAGPHRCAGSHLARIEVRVLLEEWVSMFRAFTLRPGSEAPMEAGTVWTPQKVELSWEVPA